MDPDIKNFSQIEKLIRENPKEADARYFEWQQSLKANASSSPELYSIETSEEFYRWAKEHPEKNIDPSVWVGKEISEAYYYLREQHEDSQMKENGTVDRTTVPPGLAGVPLLAASFLQKPKIMQDDGGYQKIEERLRKEWLKKNNVKDFSSNEGLDYLHGSLDDRAKVSIRKEAEEVFRSNPKFKKRVERYDKEAKKIYKDHRNDPQWLANERSAQLEINDRLVLLEKARDKKIKLSKEEIEKSQQKIIQDVQNKHREEFAEKHPEKAKIYFERIETERARREENKNKSHFGSFDVRRVFGTERPDMSGSPTTTQTETRTGGHPNISIPSKKRIGPQKDTFSKLARRINPFGKVNSGIMRRAVSQTALRGLAAFLAGPGLPIVAAIISISILTFIIVGFGGAPGSPPTGLHKQ